MTKKQRETRLDKLLNVANSLCLPSLARSAGVRRMQWREWIIVIDIVMGYICVSSSACVFFSHPVLICILQKGFSTIAPDFLSI